MGTYRATYRWRMRLNNSVWVAIVCMNSSRAVWWTPRKSPSAQRWLRQPQFFDTRLSVGKPGAPSALPWPWALSGFSRAPRPSASHIISGGERFRLSAEDLAAKCRRRALAHRRFFCRRGDVHGAPIGAECTRSIGGAATTLVATFWLPTGARAGAGLLARVGL